MYGDGVKCRKGKVFRGKWLDGMGNRPVWVIS
jgi:hypothetical protein